MTKEWLIDFENAHWCGGQANVIVVGADSVDSAVIHAEAYMEDFQRELFSEEYGESEDGEDYDNEAAHVVNKVEEYSPDHEYWKYRGTEYFPLLFVE